MESWWTFVIEKLPIFQATCQGVIRWSPLLMILFVDAQKHQPAAMRVGVPVAYALYVVGAYAVFAFDIPGDQIFHNSTIFTESTTFQGQISQSLSTLAFLMISFLAAALKDATGQAVLFPVKFATILKKAVPHVLASGVWMNVSVDQDDQLVLEQRLVPDTSEEDAGTCCGVSGTIATAAAASTFCCLDHVQSYSHSLTE